MVVSIGSSLGEGSVVFFQLGDCKMVLTISLLRKHLLVMYRRTRSTDVSYRETSYEDHLAVIGTEDKCSQPSSHSVCEKMGQASLDSFYSTALDDRRRLRW